MKKLLLFVLVLMANGSSAQLKTHTFEQAEKMSKTNPRPFVVFIHTDWCKFCKTMENTTFKNKYIVNKLNQDFYFISFNAEEKKDIIFKENTFRFKPKGNNSGIHELAEILADKNGNVVYPTLTILNSDYSIMAQLQSYIGPKELLQILSKIE